MLLSLVEELALYFKEAGITHRLREPVVGKHAFRIEVFQANQRVGAGKIGRHLMQRVLPPADYAIVDPCKLASSFPPVLTALYFTG